MNHEQPAPATQYEHRREGFTVMVERSATRNRVVYRRNLPLFVKTTSGSVVPVAKTCIRQAHRFHRDFILYTP